MQALGDLIQCMCEKNEEQEAMLADAVFQKIAGLYDEFFIGVMKGDLGPTAKFWCTYIYLVNRVYRSLVKAIRTNDVAGYMETLPHITDIFFSLNRPNYARWSVLFMAQMKAAPKEFMEQLWQGAFSIRRTSKNFARSGIDITLEKTVNRNAASPSQGIVHFTNSSDAIRRWCISSNQRQMCVGHLEMDKPSSQNTKSLRFSN